MLFVSKCLLDTICYVHLHLKIFRWCLLSCFPTQWYQMSCVQSNYWSFLFDKQIDVWGIRLPFLFLEWIGMNAMLVFVMAAQGIFPAFINGWYYENEGNSLVSLLFCNLQMLVSQGEVIALASPPMNNGSQLGGGLWMNKVFFFFFGTQPRGLGPMRGPSHGEMPHAHTSRETCSCGEITPTHTRRDPRDQSLGCWVRNRISNQLG